MAKDTKDDLRQTQHGKDHQPARTAEQKPGDMRTGKTEADKIAGDKAVGEE